ncbi:hypothetical protein WSS_A25430 [Rhodococcus opacus M213]|uniref:O-acyltransferase WSD1-like N-terminal domain-containing protein n=1 Tax=Rhodococcus opacus M213 TaxID=1129896 RepID=K8XNF2_RHOOP|nr:wax ester/triacylglycerol synthase domain-containing protein [Rhodococcus opacus]EKT79762.1 hypothetical protein WSS_A25430 [Rhodococcus opacus M213]
MFLLGESREHPMHVGGLAVFNPPDGASAADMRAMFDTALAATRSPYLSVSGPAVRSPRSAWGWDHLPHEEVDLEHHVRRAWHRLRSRPAPTGSRPPTGG